MKVYLATYGCQMNVADSEIVTSLLLEQNHQMVDDESEAEAILLNTCGIREHAEQRVMNKLSELHGNYKKNNPGLVIGVLGCMAEHLGEKIARDRPFVNLVIGPDGYRKLPELLQKAQTAKTDFELELSDYETYADIKPVREPGLKAFVAIMRGCNNLCSYCVVPYTRGQERSRPVESILDECRDLVGQGFKEITLLGQNVNSYIYAGTDFPDLIYQVSQLPGVKRVRFATSHPKDLSDKLIDVIAGTSNICNHIHLPVQSGSDRVLKLMNRTYTRSHYLKRIERIRDKIPNASITTDIIVGFCTETDEDYRQTSELMKEVEYDAAFMFKYSPRPGTTAFALPDDVPEEVKSKRLQSIISLQNENSAKKAKAYIGETEEVMAEGPSKKSAEEWTGRTNTDKVVIFKGDHRVGDFVNIKITDARGFTLFGEVLR